MPHPRDEEIQNAFNRALSEHATAHPEVVRTIQDALEEVMDTAALEAEQTALVMRIEGLRVMLDKEVQANTRTTQDPAGLPAALCQGRSRLHGSHYLLRRTDRADHRKASAR